MLEIYSKNYTLMMAMNVFERPTEATNALWSKLQELQKEERPKARSGYGN
ncbi:hypothetical protein [Dubosiella newyorkensis]